MSRPADPFVHHLGVCESVHIGERTRIWAFAHVLPEARIGSDCNICDHVFVENDVIIGDSVTVKCGVQLWDGLRVGNRVFIGPNVTFANDKYPRSRMRPASFLVTVVEDNVSIGANATILPGLRLGRGAMIGAGAVVTRDVPPFARVVGNPAKIIGYQGDYETSDGEKASAVIWEREPGPRSGSRLNIGVGGCYLERLPHFSDLRGELTPLEFNKGLPFEPARIFMVYKVSSYYVRGEHAHRECAQLLVAANGSVSVMVDDGTRRAEVRLDNRSIGLYLAPMVWGVQYKFSPDSVLLVMASQPYSNDDYIRDYDAFRKAVQP